MLAPAIYFKEEIIQEFKRLFYSDELYYYMGCHENGLPNIVDEDKNDLRQYAILDSEQEPIGYFAYHIDRYSSNVRGFGLISFSDYLQPFIVDDVLKELKTLISKFHRIEWCMVGDNPIKKHYDKFCKKYNGRMIELRDVFKDNDGNYINSYIYEIITKKG